MTWCEWLETARKILLFSPNHKTIKNFIRVGNSLWKDVLENWVGSCFRPADTLCLEKALLMAVDRGSSLLSWRRFPPQVNISASSFLLCCHLWGFPSFQFFTSRAKNNRKPKPSSVPTISPSPPATDQFWGKQRGVNGNSVNLQTSIQRGECAYLSLNTVVKKKVFL